MEIILYICRIIGGGLLMLAGGGAVILSQRDSYKKPKMLRKRLTKKQKILKKTLIILAITGGISWITAEAAPLAGLIILIIGIAGDAVFTIVLMRKDEP